MSKIVACRLKVLCHSFCGSLLSRVKDGSPVLLDSIASPVFCDPYVRKDFLTLATLLLTSNPVDTVLGGTRDLAGDWPRFPCVSGGVGGNPLLNRPISVDVFESNMFWVNRESINSVVQQDKFGRGVPVSIVRQLNNPRTLKILHPLRYNTSLIYHPCLQRPGCSHICVITGSFNNHKCLCPQGEINRQQCSKGKKTLKIDFEFLN